MHGEGMRANVETSTTPSAQRASPSGQSTPLQAAAVEEAPDGPAPRSDSQLERQPRWQPAHASASVSARTSARVMRVRVYQQRRGG